MTGTVHFSTSLRPHRSLSPEGFRWLIGAAVLASLAIGVPMLAVGAWPVFGFMGLDVLLLYLLFRHSYLDLRRRETVVLTDRELIVERVAPDGEREEHRLDAYWMRLEMDADAERLAAVSRGSRLVLGRFLSPGERRQLAEELETAHARLRGR
ncbi:MAG: DUF2244 domain-containing protein [Enhydrobacter sp.]|nr:MAG: DUF2244 domain-containing protein [Enhydrobacter sp.]